MTNLRIVDRGPHILHDSDIIHFDFLEGCFE